MIAEIGPLATEAQVRVAERLPSVDKLKLVRDALLTYEHEGDIGNNSNRIEKFNAAHAELIAALRSMLGGVEQFELTSVVIDSLIEAKENGSHEEIRRAQKRRESPLIRH